MVKPTIVLIPGAWIPLQAYDEYLAAVKQEGYPTASFGYPSLDPSDPSKTDVAADTHALLGPLRSLVDQGREVVLVMHSYAGMPGAAAAKGMSVGERKAAGKSGGVLGLLMVAAFVVPEGLSCAGLQGGCLPQWILLDKPEEGFNLPDDPKKNFAEDFEEVGAAALAKELMPHATLAFTSPQPAPAFADAAYEGRLAFQITARDLAVPKEAQNGMIDATGKVWIVKEIDGSHFSPFQGTNLRDSIAQLNEIVEAFSEA